MDLEMSRVTIRDFKQPTTTPPNSTTGSKNVLFASNAHANDFSGVDVQLWTTGDAWCWRRLVKVSIHLIHSIILSFLKQGKKGNHKQGC